MQRRQLSRYSQPNIMCSHIPSLAELSMVLISGDAVQMDRLITWILIRWIRLCIVTVL